LDGDVQLRDVGEADRVVRRGEDGFGQVLADLGRTDVERRGELDVADAVTAEVYVHQSRRLGVLRVGRVAVELNALDEGRCVIANTHDGHANTLSRHGALLNCTREVRWTVNGWR